MSHRLATILVEDEPLAREGLLAYLHEIEFIHVASICESALEANDAINRQNIDLIFLDIQMPKITGIDFLKSLKNPPMVIMTTAYPHFAVQGYELDLIDYLVKPFPFERLLKAVNKAHDFYRIKNREFRPSAKPDNFFFIRCEGRFEKLLFDEVHYVEGMENYIVVHTKHKSYITLLRMKSIEELLPAHQFLRIHKSFIVSIQAISTIDGNELVLAEKSRRLPISREKKAGILLKLTGA